MLGTIKPQGRQKEVVALKTQGHIVVLGTAGSGKTTMALLRAEMLSNLPHRPKVLIVTYNRSLVQYMNEISGSHAQNITIESFHQFAYGYLSQQGKMPKHNGIISNRDKERLVQDALQKAKEACPGEATYQRPLSVFVSEINFLEQFGVSELQEYEKMERAGRKDVRIRREDRKYFFQVYQNYLELRKEEGYLYDWDDVALYTYRALQEDHGARMYNHIIVDEGQDFSPMMLRALTSAVSENGSFTFFGDVAQQIYGGRLSWRDAGLTVQRGKVWRFDKNYRNPPAVLSLAEDITKSAFWKSDGDMVAPSAAIAEGPKPLLLHFQSSENEISWLVQKAQESAVASSAVIICRSRQNIRTIEQCLIKKGIPYALVAKDTREFTGKAGIYLSTFHSVKGLEFDNVFIPFLSSSDFPHPIAMRNAVDQAEALADELKLLYVAVTRSRFGLFMSYSGELTKLFPAESAHYKLLEEGDQTA